MLQITEDRFGHVIPAALPNSAALGQNEATPGPEALLTVVFVIAHLGFGGAQRTLTNMVNRWAARGALRPVVLVLEGERAPAYPMGQGVTVLWLNLAKNSSWALDKIANNLRRIQDIRTALQETRPDIVVAFQDSTNVLTILSCLGAGPPVVVTERTDPARHRIGAAWSALRALTYPLAAVVVAQTEAARKALPWPARRKALAIPNAILTPNADKGCASPLPRPLVLGLGRLSPEKGFSELLRAFALAAATRPAWRLAIAGDGPQGAELSALAHSLGCAERVLFVGAVQNVASWFGQADLFALPSHYEGFPNALCEAMALGLPCIATATSGAAAIIRPEVDGLLVAVGDVPQMALSLARLMDAPQERARLGAAAREVTKRFGEDQVLGLWEKLFRELRRGPECMS